LERALEELGVELIPFGKKEIFGVPVLGKGWSSVVVYGVFNNKKVAVKIQRKDSPRISLGKEASFLRITNEYKIGPTLYYEGKNFLVLEYIDGKPIKEAEAKKGHVLNVSSLISELFLKKTQFAQRMKSQCCIDEGRLIEVIHRYKQNFDLDSILNTLYL